MTKPHRMLEIKKIDDNIDVRINYSSLCVLNECHRKAHYMFEMGLLSESSQAQSFGTAIHKVLEGWYTLDVALRSEESMKDIVEVAFNGFVDADNGKHTKDNAHKIMKHYFNSYGNDGIVAKFVEKEFEFKLYDLGPLTIHCFGTIDLIGQDSEGKWLIMDHKTTSALGQEFAQRWCPNHQLTMYLMGASQILNEEVNKAIVNGIQVAKTKQDVARIELYRTSDDAVETGEAIISAVRYWLTDMHRPMAGGGTCSAWGGCRFLDICSSPRELREEIIKSKQKENGNE